MQTTPNASVPTQATVQMQATVPAGMGPGNMLQVTTAAGVNMTVQIPPNCGPGQTFQFQAPAVEQGVDAGPPSGVSSEIAPAVLLACTRLTGGACPPRRRAVASAPST
jgi:hypothetical protein